MSGEAHRQLSHALLAKKLGAKDGKGKASRKFGSSKGNFRGSVRCV